MLTSMMMKKRMLVTIPQSDFDSDINVVIAMAYHIAMHFLFYIFSLFQLTICDFHEDYFDTCFILRDLTILYRLFCKYDKTQTKLQLYAPIAKSYNYQVLILDKMFAWYRNLGIPNDYYYMRPFREKIAYTFPANVMAFNLFQMNQLSYSMVCNDTTYSFRDLTNYLHCFFKYFVSDNEAMPYVSTSYIGTGESERTLYLDICAREAIRAILSLIIIVLSFCNTLSHHGLAKIAIMLKKINKNYIHHDEKEIAQEDRVFPRVTLYCIALVIYKLKTIKMVNTISHKQWVRHTVSKLLRS